MPDFEKGFVMDLNEQLLESVLSDYDKTRELENVLTSFFGNSYQDTKNSVVHGSCLKVEYYSDSNPTHKSHNIKDIKILDDAPNFDVKELEHKIQYAILEDCGYGVTQQVLFSPLPVTGTYRFQDVFQVVPCPEDFPRPPEIMGDHPFWLEFRHKRSHDFVTDLNRKTKAGEEAFLLLDTLSRWGLKRESSSARKSWTLTRGEDGQISTEFRQLGYSGTDSQPYPRDELGFSILEGQELPLIPINDYFFQTGIRVNEAFSLSQGTSAALSRYFELSSEDKHRFRIAAYWRNASNEAYAISKSMAYIALINAIEALIQEEPAESICENCGKENKKGVSQLFREFVESYAPGVPPSRRKTFYSIRSKLSHGSHLLWDDTSGGWMTFSPPRVNEDSDFRELSRLTQILIYNWLVS